jgi:hypothetical protein
MRPSRFLLPLVALFCLLSSVPYATGLTQKAANGPSVAITVEKISVVDLAQDHIELSFLLTFLTDMDVSVRQVTFDNVRLNNLPLYVAPVGERFSLKSSESKSLEDPLKVTLFFRDLESVTPLQSALQNRRVTLEGTAYLDGELPALVKLLLLGRRVRVPVSFRQDIPLNIPESGLLQSLAGRALSLAGASVNALSSLTEGLMRRTSAWRDELWKDYAPSLLLGYVHFALRGPKGERLEYEFTGTGYRISERQFVLCKGLVEPWKFDPDIAAAIKFDHFSLDTQSHDVWVWPSGAQIRSASGELNSSTGFHLLAADFKRAAEPSDENVGFYALQSRGRPRKVDIHKRDSASNLMLFEFRNPPALSAPLKRNTSDGKAWDRVAVFRFPGGINERQARADLVFAPAVRAGSLITLQTPVDSSGWGSPLVTQDGIIGLLQDKTSGVFLRDAFNALKLK